MSLSPAIPFGDGIWTVDGPRVRMLTIPFDTRTTVVRLATGGLWIHSPIAPTDDICQAIDALGPVEHLIAPNKIHSLGIEPWHERYPSATIWVSPKFQERHPEIHIDHALSCTPPDAWRDEIDQHVFGGSKFFDEVVFLHRPSKSLIVTDLIQRHDPEKESWLWRQVKRAAGVLGESGGTARDLRAVHRDRQAAKASATEILGWDFDRVIISHGDCITDNARERVERALAWAL